MSLPRAARPEAEQVDPAVVLPLDEQDRRDQVAAEDEEQIDAEEAARQPRIAVPVRPCVVEEDADDRKGSEPVEAGAVGDMRSLERALARCVNLGGSLLGAVSSFSTASARQAAVSASARSRPQSATRDTAPTGEFVTKSPATTRASTPAAAARARTPPTTFPVSDVASTSPSPVIDEIGFGEVPFEVEPARDEVEAGDERRAERGEATGEPARGAGAGLVGHVELREPLAENGDLLRRRSLLRREDIGRVEEARRRRRTRPRSGRRGVRRAQRPRRRLRRSRRRRRPRRRRAPPLRDRGRDQLADAAARRARADRSLRRRRRA